MKLYLISQNTNNHYDTYDSAVVAAPDEASARLINPDGSWDDSVSKYSSWCRTPDDVNVKYIGEASADVETGVVCASFNAG